MTIYADRARHLITVPYDVPTLLAAAAMLDIPPHWYHGTRGLGHIDIPKRAVARVLAHPDVTVVDSREIVRLIISHRHEWKRGTR